jgi:regulator of replication initiation timing
VFKVENKIQIENAMKEHPLFKERQRTLILNSKKFIELLNINNLSLDDLDKTIKNIITQLEYSPENYIKLLEDNRVLKLNLEKANQLNNTENVFILQTENSRLKLENLKLIKRYKTLSKKTNQQVNEEEILVDDDIQSQPIAQNDLNNYTSLISTLKKTMKNSSGTYDVGGKQYELLIGTRQEVWDGKAYKTSGGLLKPEFILNKHGDIVSKRKSISETQLKRLFTSGVNKTTDLSIE